MPAAIDTELVSLRSFADGNDYDENNLLILYILINIKDTAYECATIFISHHSDGIPVSLPCPSRRLPTRCILDTLAFRQYNARKTMPDTSDQRCLPNYSA
jgi:hypothetical protein